MIYYLYPNIKNLVFTLILHTININVKTKLYL